MKTAKQSKVRISVYRVGTNFGWSAALKLRNGRQVATLDTPRPFESAARSAAEELAAKLGYAIA